MPCLVVAFGEIQHLRLQIVHLPTNVPKPIDELVVGNDSRNRGKQPKSCRQKSFCDVGANCFQ